MPEPDEDMPSLTRPAREVDPGIKLRENMINRARALNEAMEKVVSVRLAVEAAERLLAEHERDVAVRQANWQDAINAYRDYEADL
jgi:hypothetical protein